VVESLEKADEAMVKANRFEGRGNNIILMGIMGAGKSTIGWHLARMLGFGFVDVDQVIETQSGKAIEKIFEQEGETYFRNLETSVINGFAGIRSHVIAVGGGAVLDDENWKTLRGMGPCVWLDTPAVEIARRFVMKPDEIRSRPLIADIGNAASKDERFKMLQERIQEIVGQRANRYGEADVSLSISYSTPESAAGMIKTTLQKNGAWETRS
jgi:shikimate kinase